MGGSRSRAAALGLTLAILLAAGGARATDMLSLSPGLVNVRVGNPVDLTLTLDFSDITLGGAVSVAYDATLLDLTSISFDPSLPDDPDFRCPTAGLPTSVGCPPNPTFVSFGTLAGLPTGQPVPVATLHFLALGAGTSDVTLSVSNAFSDVVGSPLPVSLGSAQISALPEPSAGLLLLPAAATLLWSRRRRRLRA